MGNGNHLPGIVTTQNRNLLDLHLIFIKPNPPDPCIFYCMFRFANPEFLILLVPSVFYLIWWTQRKRPGLRYSDVSILNGLPRGRAGFARWISVGWRAISLIGLALAIAGPRIPDLKTRLPAEGIAVVVAMDVSGSMGEEDFTWTGLEKPISRLTSAKRVLRLFAVGGEGPDGV